MEEIWKVYYHGLIVKYEVSNQGRVKRNGILIEPKIDKNNYYRIRGNILLHRAVAELFIPNPENKPCIDHINTNRLDNRAENLRWCTHKENCNNPISLIHRGKASKGRIPWNKGKETSLETKNKMSEARKQYWINYKNINNNINGSYN